MQQNPPCEISGCFSKVLLFLLVPKSGNPLKEQTETTDKVNSFFLEKEKSILGTLQFKVKYIKTRRGHGCNFIKKEEYKYILAKSMPPFTNVSLFLMISPKKLHLPPRNFNEKCSNRSI